MIFAWIALGLIIVAIGTWIGMVAIHFFEDNENKWRPR